MDVFKQVGKSLNRNRRETENNTRRVAENFPLVETKVDHLVFDYPYQMEFKTSNHPHAVKLNLAVRPPENCFKCQSGTVSAVGIDAVADLGHVDIVDGDAHPIIYDGFSSNHGGFILDPAGGVIVPVDGVYNLQMGGFTVGLTLSFTDAIIASVRRNGVVFSQMVWSVENGKLSPPYGFVDITFTQWGLCMPCRAGDTIGGWLAASVGFFDPNGLTASIQLVGQG